MPMDRSRYPDNWKEIADAIKERAGWKCEECGVEHGAYIVRNTGRGDKIIRVVITVHHIGVEKPDGSPGDPNDKMDCRPENLIALCPRCHLLADQPNHLASAKKTRQRKRFAAIRAAGQLTFWDDRSEHEGSVSIVQK